MREKKKLVTLLKCVCPTQRYMTLERLWITVLLHSPQTLWFFQMMWFLVFIGGVKREREGENKNIGLENLPLDVFDALFAVVNFQRGDYKVILDIRNEKGKLIIFANTYVSVSQKRSPKNGWTIIFVRGAIQKGGSILRKERG